MSRCGNAGWPSPPGWPTNASTACWPATKRCWKTPSRKRIYQIGRQQVAMLVLDGTRQWRGARDPRDCFRRAGWAVTGAESLAMPGGSATVVRLAGRGQTREALYWISDGATRHGSMNWYRWQTVWRRLTGGWSGPAPVLVILQPTSDQNVRWELLLQQFPEIVEL
jgi:hypothetical protein